jgi:hypothetical protein
MHEQKAPADLDTVAAVAKGAGSSFTDQSYLTYVIPSETNINLEEAFTGLQQGKPILESLPQRQSLFFGMHSHKRSSLIAVANLEHR